MSPPDYKVVTQKNGIITFSVYRVSIDVFEMWLDYQERLLSQPDRTSILMVIDTNGQSNVPFIHITNRARREEGVTIPPQVAIRHAWVMPASPMVQLAMQMTQMLIRTDLQARFFEPGETIAAYEWLLRQHQIIKNKHPDVDIDEV